jgi:hypothetical protein
MICDGINISYPILSRNNFSFCEDKKKSLATCRELFDGILARFSFSSSQIIGSLRSALRPFSMNGRKGYDFIFSPATTVLYCIYSLFAYLLLDTGGMRGTNVFSANRRLSGQFVLASQDRARRDEGPFPDYGNVSSCWCVCKTRLDGVIVKVSDTEEFIAIFD